MQLEKKKTFERLTSKLKISPRNHHTPPRQAIISENAECFPICLKAPERTYFLREFSSNHRVKRSKFAAILPSSVGIFFFLPHTSRFPRGYFFLLFLPPVIIFSFALWKGRLAFVLLFSKEKWSQREVFLGFV